MKEKDQFVKSYSHYLGEMGKKILAYVDYRSDIDDLMKKDQNDLSIEDRSMLYAFGLAQLEFAKDAAASSHIVRLVEDAFSIIDRSSAYKFVDGKYVDGLLKSILKTKKETKCMDEFNVILSYAVDHIGGSQAPSEDKTSQDKKIEKLFM